MNAPTELTQPTLSRFENRVDRRVDDPAMLDAQQAMGRPIREAQLTEASADGKARLVAVVPRLEHADRWPNKLLGIPEVADTPHLVRHNLAFELQLQIVGGVLPTTPTASLAIVRAGRLDSPLGGTLELQEFRPSKIASHLLQLHEATFARQRTRDEYDPPILKMSDRLPAEGGVCQLDLDGFDRNV